MSAQSLSSMIKTMLPHSDPRMKHFFMMKSPSNLFAIITFYVVAVYVIAPRFMKNRRPFSLRRLLMVYNVTQIVSNFAFFMMCLQLLPRFSLWCSEVDTSRTLVAQKIVRLHYYYVLLKVYDLVETLFFVLRHKPNQMSFLHIYHHIITLVCAWISGHYFPGGTPYFLCLANTFTHVVMYSYYLVTSSAVIGAATIKSWKKCMTMIQLVQLMTILVIYVVAFVNPSCGYPKPFLAFAILVLAVMISLFLNFYKKAYVEKVK